MINLNIHTALSLGKIIYLKNPVASGRIISIILLIEKKNPVNLYLEERFQIRSHAVIKLILLCDHFDIES